MKLSRNLSSKDLIKVLNKLGYVETRQKGKSYKTDKDRKKLNSSLTIPNHNPIKVGTLNSILNDIFENLKNSKKEILSNFFKLRNVFRNVKYLLEITFK